MAVIPVPYLRVTVAKNTIPGLRIIPWFDTEFNRLPETKRHRDGIASSTSPQIAADDQLAFAIRNESGRTLTGMMVDWAATADPEDCIGVWLDPFYPGCVGVPPGGSALTRPGALELGNQRVDTTFPQTRDLTFTIDYALFDDGTFYGLDEASFEDTLRLARARREFMLKAAAAPDLSEFMFQMENFRSDRAGEGEQYGYLRDRYTMAQREEGLSDADFIRRALADTELYAGMRFTLVD